MKLSRAVPLAGLVALAGCASGGSSAAAGTDAGGTPSAAATSPSANTRLIATLNANGGRMSGTVTLTPAARANQTRAAVTIINGPANAELGWQIRQGQCGERGPELGAAAAYRAIQTRGDGSGEVAATLPIAMPANNAYHVNILASRTSDAVLACGGLSEVGAP